MTEVPTNFIKLPGRGNKMFNVDHIISIECKVGRRFLSDYASSSLSKRKCKIIRREGRRSQLKFKKGESYYRDARIEIHVGSSDWIYSRYPNNKKMRETYKGLMYSIAIARGEIKED